MACTRQSTCDAYEEHPERSWVLCQRRWGHLGRHRWKRFRWHDDNTLAPVSIRVLRLIARRTARAQQERTTTP